MVRLCPTLTISFFAIAIQVGLVGGAILTPYVGCAFSMFIGRGFVGAIGQAGRYTELHRVAFQ